jgi:hypothetical protein
MVNKISLVLMFAFSLIFVALFVNFVSAETSYGTCNMGVTLVNQDPYPAVPDSYVNVLFQVSGVSNPDCKGARFQVIPTYPFTIDGDSSMQTLQGNTYASGYKSEWTIPYKIKVDKDAVDGDNNIEVRYSSLAQSPDLYISKLINISVKDSRTDFDLVIQQINNQQVSIALANTGKNTANSVIVKVPEQDVFRVSGTNGQMIGNLNSGDYTLVSFNLLRRNMNATGASSYRRNQTSQQTSPQTAQNFANPVLKLEISYTDGIGIRRTTTKNISVDLRSFASESNSTNGNGFSGARRQTQTTSTSLFSSWQFWVIAILIAVIVVWVYLRYSENIKEFLSRKKSSSKADLPDWIKKENNKEKHHHR